MTPDSRPERPNMGSNKKGPANILAQAEAMTSPSSRPAPVTAPPGPPSSPATPCSPPPCPTPTCGHTACESAALARIAASWRRGWLPPPGLRNRRKKHGLRPFRSPGLRKRRLNAAFVAWLMGWPAGWTSFGRAETESFRSRAGRHLSSLLTSWGFSVTLG